MHTADTTLLILALAVQLTGAAFAARMLVPSDYAPLWLSLITAFLLLIVRQSYALYHVATGLDSIDYLNECTVLGVSALLLYSIISVRKRLPSLRHAEATIKESQAISTGILSSIFDTYYRTDKRGRITLISPSILQLLQYTDKEILGQNFFEYYGDQEQRDELADQLRTQGFVRGAEAKLTRKDGSTIMVEANAQYTRDANGNTSGMEGIVRDISERFETEEINTRLGRIIEDSANEVYVFDGDTLNFILVNRGARENLGYTMEELRQLTPLDIKPNYTAEMFTELTQPLFDDPSSKVEFETVHARKDGSTYPVEINLQITREEQPSYFFAIVQDITQRKQSANALFQSQKMEAVGQLTGGIAHDFNNLLTIVMGNLELMKKVPDLPPAATRYLREAYSTIEKAKLLTQHLLAFSKKQALKPEVVDPAELVSEISTILRRTIPENITIEVDRDDTRDFCEIDPIQFENTLLNLTFNARDAMPDGGKITISVTHVILDEAAADEMSDIAPGPYARIAFSDTGHGMSETVSGQVFEPFFSTKEAGKGSGLGLSMVYGFVQQSGGNVDIHSDEGLGTTICLYLPTTDKAQAPAADVLSDSNILRLGNGERILIVEDNAALGEVVEEMLLSLNYKPAVVLNGDLAVTYLAENTVDLLLTDVILPGSMNGVEIAQKVASNWPEVKVLFMSGYTGDTMIHDGKLDVDKNLLEKPFTIEALALNIAKSLA